MGIGRRCLAEHAGSRAVAIHRYKNTSLCIVVQVKSSATDEGWDSDTVIGIVRAQSGRRLSIRQLQTWDRSGLLSANTRAGKGKRIYTFREVRRLCIIANLLNANVSPQRLKVAIQNIDRATTEVGKPWESLRIVTDGESVFVVDGVIALDAIRGQIVNLILLGDLQRKARKACQEVPRPAAAGGRLGRK
jgi:DNA-binding transcriptional MerR regulator